MLVFVLDVMEDAKVDVLDVLSLADNLVVMDVETLVLGVLVDAVDNVIVFVLLDAPMLAKVTVEKVAAHNAGVLVRLDAGELLSNI